MDLYEFISSMYPKMVSHRVMVSPLHSGWENPSSSLFADFELG